MKAKLKLNLEQLSVDSFNTTAAEKPKGTVFGEQCTCYTQCTCPGCPTCDHTCAHTCDDATCPACPTCAASCNGSCAGASCENTCHDTCAFTCAACNTGEACTTQAYSNCYGMPCW
jgi:hypothetical protein